MHRIDEEFAPGLSQHTGFVCYFAFKVDETSIGTLSVFHDAASAARARELTEAYIDDNLADFKLTDGKLSGGEVMVSRTVADALQDAHRWRTGGVHRALVSEGDVSHRPVLVAGATGRTGRLIVERLVERGLTVHALVRDPVRGREQLPASVRQFVGDVCASNTLAAPMTGVGTVIVATAGGGGHANTAELVDYFGTLNVVRQAVASRVELLILISTIGATRPEYCLDVEPTSVGWKAMGEEVIRSSGVPYCIVRAGWLTDGPGGEAVAVSQGDDVDGRISRADLADVCARLLILPAARGKTLNVIAARNGTAAHDLDSAIAAAAPDAAPRVPVAS